jgi:hypothetical protein
VEEYLTTVTEPKIKKILNYVQTRCRRGQTWLSREDRLCAHCPQNEVETEQHFLTSCPMYGHIRDTHFPQITQTHEEFEHKSNIDKLPYLSGEIQQKDVLPVAMRKGQPVEHKPHIHLFIHPPLLFVPQLFAHC